MKGLKSFKLKASSWKEKSTAYIADRVFKRPMNKVPIKKKGGLVKGYIPRFDVIPAKAGIYYYQKVRDSGSSPE